MTTTLSTYHSEKIGFKQLEPQTITDDSFTKKIIEITAIEDIYVLIDYMDQTITNLEQSLLKLDEKLKFVKNKYPERCYSEMIGEIIDASILENKADVANNIIHKIFFLEKLIVKVEDLTDSIAFKKGRVLKNDPQRVI